MNFKLWFENNKEEIVSFWSKLKKDIPFNESEIFSFTKVMAEISSISAITFLFNQNFYSSHNAVYDGPIANGGLLSIGSKILKNAKGYINSSEYGSRFLFCMSKNPETDYACDDSFIGKVDVGSILIRLPFLSFEDKKDFYLLKSIIKHECTHAYYWNNKSFRQNNDMPLISDIDFDNEKYLKNLYEATAIVQQLNSLVEDIGISNIDKLIKYLESNIISDEYFMKQIIPYFKTYLNSLIKEESDLNKNKNLIVIFEEVLNKLKQISRLLAFKNFTAI